VILEDSNDIVIRNEFPFDIFDELIPKVFLRVGTKEGGMEGHNTFFLLDEEHDGIDCAFLGDGRIVDAMHESEREVGGGGSCLVERIDSALRAATGNSEFTTIS
jgi:hypothetical protein